MRTSQQAQEGTWPQNPTLPPLTTTLSLLTLKTNTLVLTTYDARQEFGDEGEGSPCRLRSRALGSGQVFLSTLLPLPYCRNCCPWCQ